MAETFVSGSMPINGSFLLGPIFLHKKSSAGKTRSVSKRGVGESGDAGGGQNRNLRMLSLDVEFYVLGYFLFHDVVQLERLAGFVGSDNFQ